VVSLCFRKILLGIGAPSGVLLWVSLGKLVVLLVFGRFRVCFWAILAGFVAGVLAGRSGCSVAKFGRFWGCVVRFGWLRVLFRSSCSRLRGRGFVFCSLCRVLSGLGAGVL